MDILKLPRRDVVLRRVSPFMTFPAESNEVADYVLTLAPACDMVNIDSLTSTGLTRNEVLLAVVKIPHVYFNVVLHLP